MGGGIDHHCRLPLKIYTFCNAELPVNYVHCFSVLYNQTKGKCCVEA